MTDGIYTRRRAPGREPARPMAEVVEALQEAARRPAWAEWFASELLPQLCELAGPRLRTVPYADDDERERHLDASRAAELAQWLASRLDDPALRLAIRNAVELGRLVERLHVRQFEPLVRSAKACSAGGARGAAVTNEAHVELHSQYADLVLDKMSEGLGLDAARQAVADKLKVTKRTVSTHTRHLGPQRRGRPPKSPKVKPPPG